MHQRGGLRKKIKTSARGKRRAGLEKRSRKMKQKASFAGESWGKGGRLNDPPRGNILKVMYPEGNCTSPFFFFFLLKELIASNFKLQYITHNLAKS